MPFKTHLYAVVTSITIVATLMVSRKSLKSLLIGSNVVVNNSFNDKNSPHLNYFSDVEKYIRNYDNYMPVLSENVEKTEDGKVIIYILGLFEFSTAKGLRLEGFSEANAAQLAVKHVNENNVIPGYILKLLVNDTKVRNVYNLVLEIFKCGCSLVNYSSNILIFGTCLKVHFWFKFIV